MNSASPLKSLLIAITGITMMAASAPMALAKTASLTTLQQLTPQYLESISIAAAPPAPAYRQTCAGVAWQARHGLNSAQYQQTLDQMTAAGYRPVQVNGYGVSNNIQYAAIWDKCTTGPWSARYGLTAAQYQQELDRMTGLGYQPVWVSGYGYGSQSRFAGIWEKKPNPNIWAMRFGMKYVEYEEELLKRQGEGYDLMQVSSYNVDGLPLYAAIWEKRSSVNATHVRNLSSTDYQDAFNNLIAQGYTPVQTSIANKSIPKEEPGCVFFCYGELMRVPIASYTGIFVKKPGNGWASRHGMTADEYQQQFNIWTAKGYRLVNVSGADVGGQIRYAAIWEK
jgi:Bacterial tandem repeat domain 1